MTDAMLTVIATSVIDRPLTLVREHFADLDHAVRDGLHEGVSLKWLPARTAGERRLRREVRVLGVAQVDEYTVEVEPDGTVVRRFTEGPNAGAMYRDSFADEGLGRTRVTTVATVPATGFKWAIGPVFKLAVKKALEKELVEHKRDLEGAYEPGRARGNLVAALDALGSLQEKARACTTDAERAALITPVVEAACVTAVADDTVDDAEREAIRAVVRAVGVATLDEDALEAVVASSIDRTRTEGVEKRCDDLGARLRVMDLANEGLSAATLVAQVSHGIDQNELATLQRMARAAGVAEDTLVALIDRIDRRLSGLPA